MHEVHVGCAVFVLVEAEDVDVVDVVRGDGVLDLIVLEVLKALLVDLRFLEAKLLAEAKHLLAIEVDDVTEVPTQEARDLADVVRVVLGSLVADTGRLALLHVVLEADLVLALGDLVRGEVEVAGADRVEVAHHGYGCVCHTYVGIRAEAHRAIVGGTALDADAGEGLMADDDLRIGLVVLEKDVVAGLMLLDEGVLEDKGLSFGAHDDVLDTADLAHQKAGLRAGYVALEVATDAATQVLRLPDVDDRALLADVLVAAGGFGERREDLAYFVERHRVLSEGGGAKSPLLQQRYGKDGALPLPHEPSAREAPKDGASSP